MFSRWLSRWQSNQPSNHSDLNSDPYSGVLSVLLLSAFAGSVCALWGGSTLTAPVLFDVAEALGLFSCALLGVMLTRLVRDWSRKQKETPQAEVQEILTEAASSSENPSVKGDSSTSQDASRSPGVWKLIFRAIWNFIRSLGTPKLVSLGTVLFGLIATCVFLSPRFSPDFLVLPLAATAAGLCLFVALLFGIAARYLANLDSLKLPESPALCRWCRVMVWILISAAVSMLFSRFRFYVGLWFFHDVIQTINLIFILSFANVLRMKSTEAFPIDFAVLSVLGSRANLFASVVDSAEAQLGIDLRSTWALTVVRESLEPLLIGLLLCGWLSTSFTVVGIHEQALVEHWGVPDEGPPLPPGLHVHWPWPMDEVFRIPMQLVHSVEVGHEGEEKNEGPENVLWAVEHAENEYTLLLGNGRDLITVDAAVQYKITDARAWRYQSQNPDTLLRAIAYRAVMRATVSRTLSDTLSENLSKLTEQMRKTVQMEADAMKLGVKITGFTVGGMHPPVPVAQEYEAVVSAELGKVTSVVQAQAYHNQTVPTARASVITAVNAARAESAQALAIATGEAWSFRTLEVQYRVAPSEYFFRRRLETLEAGLAKHRFSILDSRIERDGGEIWLTR